MASRAEQGDLDALDEYDEDDYLSDESDGTSPFAANEENRQMDKEVRSGNITLGGAVSLNLSLRLSARATSWMKLR